MGDADLQFVETSAPDDIAPDSARLRRSSWASTTRRVHGPVHTAEGRSTPTPGDLLLARVDAIGFHSCLQLPDGRRSSRSFAFETGPGRGVVGLTARPHK